MSAIKTDINDNKYNIEIIDSKIESQEESDEAIRNLKSIEVDKIKDKMSGHIDEIETKNTTIDTQDDVIKTLYEDISDKPDEKAKYTEASEQRAELERNRKAFEKELSFYEHNDDCPTCKQGIDHDFKQEQIIDKNQRKAAIETGLVTVASDIETHTKRLNSISKIEEQIQSVNFKISETRAEIKMAKNALLSYKRILIQLRKKLTKSIPQSLLLYRRLLLIYKMYDLNFLMNTKY